MLEDFFLLFYSLQYAQTCWFSRAHIKTIILKMTKIVAVRNKTHVLLKCIRPAGLFFAKYGLYDWLPWAV